MKLRYELAPANGHPQIDRQLNSLLPEMRLGSIVLPAATSVLLRVALKTSLQMLLRMGVIPCTLGGTKIRLSVNGCCDAIC